MSQSLGNQLSSRDDLEYTELFSSCCSELRVPLCLTISSGNIWSFLKEVKALDMLDGECGMSLVPMQGNQASSRFDLGYTELFHVAVVTSVSL